MNNDKTDAIVEFIRTCPSLTSNALFFNFGNVENNAHQIIVDADDVYLHKPYIDGSVLKRYTFNIDCFKAVGFNPMVDGLADENVDDFAAAQAVLNWINTQNDLHNYPNFGNACIIDEMRTLTTKPETLMVDVEVSPPVAIYRISVRIDYLDISKRIY